MTSVAGVIAGLVALMGLSWPMERREVLGELEVTLSSMAQDRARTVQSILDDGFGTARTMAGYPTIVELAGRGSRGLRVNADAADHIGGLLSTLVRENHFRFAAAYDRNQRLVARSTDSIPFVLPSTAAWATALWRDSAAIDIPPFSEALDGTLLFVVPVHDPGDTQHPVGVAVLAKSLRQVSSGLVHQERIPGRETSASLVLRIGDSVVVLGEPQPGHAQQRRMHYAAASPALRAALEPEARFGEFETLPGEGLFAATRKLPGLDWGVLVSADRSAVLAQVTDQVLDVMWILGSIALGFLGLGIALLRSLQARHRASLLQVNSRATERLRLQIDCMPVACVVIDPAALTVMEWNPAATRIFGYERAEAVGRDPFELIVASGGRAATADFVRRVGTSDGVVEVVSPNVTRDGRPIWCEWTNVPLRDESGGLVGIMGMAQDITAQRESREQLRLLSRAVDQSPAAVVILDAQLQVVYVNSRFHEITGYSAEEVIGKTPRLWHSENNPPELFTHMGEVIRSGKTWQGNVLTRAKDGHVIDEAATITPVTDAKGTITHYLAVKEDVSERKRLETELRQAQKMEAVGRLAGGVAHDFNNILTVILGDCELLLAVMPEKDRYRRDIVEIEASARRAAALTRQLLAFSRRQIIQPKVLDVNATIESLGKMLRRLLGEDVTLATTFAPNLGRITADPGQLEQVLLNLSVNARDAMPRGGRLTIQTCNVDVRPHDPQYPEAEPGPHVQVTFSDTGCGMTPEILAHVFEPFFTTKAVGKGTGLGLSTVYGIVKQSRGSIYVTSSPGNGTTFTMIFPRTPEIAPENAAPLKNVAGGRETVLLVEDEDKVRSITRRALEQRGYRVIDANNGADALAIATEAAGPIDLLLTDLVMPGMSGQELAREIGRRMPGTRILFMSGYSESAAIQGGLGGLGADFIPKPFTIDDIALKVRAVLDGPAIPAN